MLELKTESMFLVNETFAAFCGRRRQEARHLIPPVRSGYEALGFLRSNLPKIEAAALVQISIQVDAQTGRQLVRDDRLWQAPLWEGLVGLGIGCIAAVEGLRLCVPQPLPAGFDSDDVLIAQPFLVSLRKVADLVITNGGRRPYRSGFEVSGDLVDSLESLRVAARNLDCGPRPAEADQRLAILSILAGIFVVCEFASEQLGLCKPEA